MQEVPIENIAVSETKSIISPEGRVELKDIVNRTHGTIRSYLYILFSPLFGGEISLGPVKIMMNAESPQESMAQLQYHLTRPCHSNTKTYSKFTKMPIISISNLHGHRQKKR